MTLSPLLALTLLLIVIAFARLRVEPGRRAVVNWAMVFPTAIVLLIYAWFFNQWLTVGASVIIAAILVAVWWVAYGSYLPAPTSDNIKVWGQEDGSKPIKPETTTIAVLEEEVQKLKEEKEKAEEELKRLKAKQNGK